MSILQEHTAPFADVDVAFVRALLASTSTCTETSEETASSSTLSSVSISRVRALEQSTVAELVLSFVEPPSGTSASVGRSATRDVLALLKRASISQLRATCPCEKSEAAWAVNAASFTCEGAWARLAPTAALTAAGVRVPRPLGVVIGGAAGADAVTTLQELLPPLHWREERSWDTHDATAVLELLARFHAFFFTHDAEREELLAGGAFTTGGGWWRATLRPSVNYDTLPVVFAANVAASPSFSAAGVGGDGDVALVQKLASRARALHAAVARGQRRTLAHGDAKSSNIFFSRDGGAPAVFDFQWLSGAPHGLSDVAYVLAGAVSFDALSNGGEGRLVAAYRDALEAALYEGRWSREAAAAEAELSSMTRALDAELVCYFATATPYLMRGWDEEVAAANLERYGFLTHEDDPRVAAWLARRSLDVMRGWEAGVGGGWPDAPPV